MLMTVRRIMGVIGAMAVAMAVPGILRMTVFVPVLVSM
jgi:hypothetical protein